MSVLEHKKACAWHQGGDELSHGVNDNSDAVDTTRSDANGCGDEIHCVASDMTSTQKTLSAADTTIA